MRETSQKPHVILGLLTFGPDPPARITTLHEFKSVLDVYQSRGYSEVDTARSYNGGQQEGFTRDAGWIERGLTLATKLFPDPTKTSPEEHAEDVRQQLETSLKELGTDCIDTLYLHAPSRDVSFSVTLSTIDGLFQEGKFKRFGLSNYAAFEVAEIVMICEREGWVRPSIYQGTYNALARSVEDELLPCLRHHNISFYAYSPLAGGLLTDRYNANSIQPSEGRFSQASGKLGAGYREMWFRGDNLQALKPVHSVAQRHGITMLQVALRWMVHHSRLHVKENGLDGVVIGASSRQQLKENLDALEQGLLPREVVERLDEAWKMVKVEADHYWAGKLEYGCNNQEALVSKP